MNRLGLFLILLTPSVPVIAADHTYRTDHTVVNYSEMAEDYAKALARIATAARAVAIESFGFDMPETIVVSAHVDPRGGTRLYNDGRDRLYLNVRNEKSLLKPSDSGVFHIYGICHETGHLAMYRLIRDHGWMTSEAAEGWAHALGSRIVDEVHAREGADLWPDRHDYLATGTARLKKQLAEPEPGGIAKAASLWTELMDIVGDKNVAPIFRAWNEAEIDPADPAAALRKALLATNDDARLGDWWNKAEPLLVFKRPRSGFAARTADRKELLGRPVEFAHDDGKKDGAKSIAGGGHAVRFEVPGDTWYLTSVRIHGARYGYPRPPKEDFHVWLCDREFKTIAEFPFPYARFKKGDPKWVTLKTDPVNVPSEFIICVGFNPTGTKGVYLSRDAEATGHSLTGLPGKKPREFTDGDWLIRIKLDQLKDTNALTTPEKP